MHQSSMDKMAAFRNKYLGGREGEALEILDLGSCDVNGTYKSLFDVPSWRYIGADMSQGINVDIVLSDPYNWREIESSSIDVLISGQAFEHIEFFWLTMLEIARVLKAGGLCCIIAPSAGFEHKYPVDCWRFYQDGFSALARFAQLDVLEVTTQTEDLRYKDNSDIWKDTVLICRKPVTVMDQQSDMKRFLQSHILYKQIAEGKVKPFPFNPLEYSASLFQEPQRLSDVTAWHEHIPFAFVIMQMIRPKLFVELGTHKGDSFLSFCQVVDTLRMDTACYAVDTWNGDEHAGHYDENVLEELKAYHDPLYGRFSTLLKSTFDEALGYFLDGSIDLLHIDGLHAYEAVKHDFESWLPKMSKRGVIFFHDINVWERNFGVWRLWDELKTMYPNFEFKHGHGLGVVAVGEIPESLEVLFSADSQTAITINHFFYALGSRIAIPHRVKIDKDRQLAEKDRQIENIYNTWSWKITAPLRAVFKILKQRKG